MRGVWLVLCLAATHAMPETGDTMTWGEANRAFAANEGDRDYGRVSASLDAADQFAGFRPSDHLTRGVPFSKVPQLNFNGFAQGKMDSGLDAYARQLTPYLSSSHFQNNMRKPLPAQFIYPQATMMQSPGANRMAGPSAGSADTKENNFDLEQQSQTATMPGMGMGMGGGGMGMGMGGLGMGGGGMGMGMGGLASMLAPPQVDLSMFQQGQNPYAFASPMMGSVMPGLPQQPLMGGLQTRAMVPGRQNTPF